MDTARSSPSARPRKNKLTAYLRFLRNLTGFIIQRTNNYVEIVATNDMNRGFAINTWDFKGSGTSGSLTHPYMNRVQGITGFPPAYMGTTDYIWSGTPEVTYTSGTPAQGNNKPASLFNKHFVAIVYGRAFDPSYGREYSLPSEFDSVAVSGYFRDEPLWMANGVATPAILFRKNPNGINIQWEQRTY